MPHTMSDPQIIASGGWGRTAARVLGLGVASFFVNAVVFLSLLFTDQHLGALPWLVIPIAVLISPAYGWMEYRAARQRNRYRAARAAKIAAIFVLVVNGVLFAWVWLAADALKHGFR